ncbi:MAG: glutamine-hydrolyzing carbamoyl-phosphate synthase small subunit [Myxococcota bacterium]
MHAPAHVPSSRSQVVPSVAPREGALVLKDGTVLRGEAFGAPGVGTGEVVFNTSLCGYPEILTDPSYAGQIVTLTQTQVGNYGVTLADLEATRPHATGLVVRARSLTVSNWRADLSLEAWLTERGIPALCGVDTRALVRHLRTAGAMPGIIYNAAPGERIDEAALVERARTLSEMDGQEWVSRATCRERHVFTEGVGPLPDQAHPFPVLPEPTVRPRVVAYDYGVKRNILRLLVSAGFEVTVVPAETSAADVLALKPDGVFLSNGPGDPAACTSLVREVGALLGRVPMFGICLGHQLTSLACGARTFKLKFGHRGGNQPVQDLTSGRVQVTSQNHGFAVDPDRLPQNVRISELNLSDGTVEGLHLPEHRAFTVQYHPEAAPGPHDTRHHFLVFRRMTLGASLEEAFRESSLSRRA